MKKVMILRTPVAVLIVSLVILVAGSLIVHAQPSAQAVVPSGYEAIDYFTYEDLPPNNLVGGPVGFAFGPGGGFGDAIYLADYPRHSLYGRVFQTDDINGDGDALDAGESTVLFKGPETSGLKWPTGWAFARDVGNGFDNDLFLTDDGSNSVLRISDNTGPPTISTFKTGFFTPAPLVFTLDGSLLLVIDAQNFTAFGGGSDGRIFAVTDAGVKTTWADGSNTTNGLYDVNEGVAMKSDGWLVVGNHTIGPSGGPYSPNEVLAFRDSNSDGDANDPGELRFLMKNVFSQGAAKVYDATDVLFISAGTNIYRLEDLNSDNDFWDAGADDLDAGESTLFAENLPGPIGSLTFAPNGDLFVASYVTNPDTTRTGYVTRIREVGPPPTPTPTPTLVPGLNQWGLMVMASLLGGLVYLRMRRRSRVRSS